MNKLWFIIRSKLPGGRKYIIDKINEEAEKAKSKTYESFEDFLQDCPEYQVKSDFMTDMIRKIYSGLGMDFQQYVFIDKGDPVDKTAWLRREKHKVIHEKGTYFLPWNSEKKIIYFDIQDSRPLIDLTEEMDWRNGDMCADVVTAVTNNNNMRDLRGEQESGKLNMYILGLGALIVISIIVSYSISKQIDANQQAVLEQLKIIANQTLEIRP